MVKAAVATLKKMEQLPPDPKDLPKAIKDYLIDSGKVDPYYGEVFKRVVTMRKLLDDDKINEIPQRDIELIREYVRRFVRDLAPVLEERVSKKGKIKARKAATATGKKTGKGKR